jgi:hypothetical protein
MGTKAIPQGCAVEPNHDRAFIESDDYEHWTVADLIEMLSEHNPDARVWIENDSVIWPVEMVAGSESEVFLS